MLNLYLSSERVEAAWNRKVAPYRWGPPLVTPVRACNQRLVIIQVSIYANAIQINTHIHTQTDRNTHTHTHNPACYLFQQSHTCVANWSSCLQEGEALGPVVILNLKKAAGEWKVASGEFWCVCAKCLHTTCMCWYGHPAFDLQALLAMCLCKSVLPPFLAWAWVLAVLWYSELPTSRTVDGNPPLIVIRRLSMNDNWATWPHGRVQCCGTVNCRQAVPLDLRIR